MARSRLGRLACTTAAAAIAVSPLLAGAGVAGQPPDAATTVEAVTVGIPPAPNVGEGATHFTVEQLQEARAEAREAYIDTRDASEKCGVGLAFRATEFRSAEDWLPTSDGGQARPGTFYLGGLYASMRDAQMEIQRTAEAAAAATEAALDARTRLGRGLATAAETESTELARQAAVKAFQDAQAKAEEAQARIVDAETAIQAGQGATARDVRDFILARATERESGFGVVGVYVPSEWNDLRLSETVAYQVELFGQPALRVKGKVHNTRRRAIGMPPLWFTVVDRFGTPLKSETARPGGRNRIPAGGSLPFTYDLKPLPEKAVRAVVTFAPDHQVSFSLPPGTLCERTIPNDDPG